jgi:hypothetical protein
VARGIGGSADTAIAAAAGGTVGDKDIGDATILVAKSTKAITAVAIVAANGVADEDIAAAAGGAIGDESIGDAAVLVANSSKAVIAVINVAAIAAAAGGTVGDKDIGDATILVANSSKAIATVITATTIVEAANGTGTFVDQKHATLTAAITQVLVCANPVASAGNVMSDANKTYADNYINTALNLVTGLITSKGWDQQSVENAGNDISSLIKVQKEAADSYLNTNYEEASQDFKNALLAMKGSISTIIQGYRLAEAALSLIEG